MKKIFLDLEMNGVNRQYKEVRLECKSEVIEFGAVKLDENNVEIARFQSYVRPAYNEEIERKITRLTGITTEQVQNADDFLEVFLQFLCWCGEDYEIYSWSENDEIQLRKEYNLKAGDELPEIDYMFSNWNDLQEQYGDLFEFARPTALSMAVNNAGIEFRGKMHNALDDAAATADLYREMISGNTIRRIKEDLHEAKKPLGISLGDLFSNLQIA